MAEDKYKVDKTKPPKPIQLKDASGIHELSDERNYEFLNKLFEMKELDPFAKEAYDVNKVYQLMDPKGEEANVKGFYAPETYKGTVSGYMKGIPEWLEDFKKHGPRLGGGDVKERDVVAVLDDAWNTEQGLNTLLHELRHRAFKNNPDYQDIIKDTEIGVKEFSSGQKVGREEMITRAFDVIYFGNKTALEFLQSLKLSKRETRELNKAVNALTKDFESPWKTRKEKGVKKYGNLSSKDLTK